MLISRFVSDLETAKMESRVEPWSENYADGLIDSESAVRKVRRKRLVSAHELRKKRVAPRSNAQWGHYTAPSARVCCSKIDW